MAGVRFEDVELLGALSRIVDLHTQHYKEDFDLDKELISKLAVSDRSEDKQLLWMSRPCGTYTLREREVYLEGSHENKVWRLDVYKRQVRMLLSFRKNIFQASTPTETAIWWSRCV